MSIEIRNILNSDNPILAAIIRGVLKEHGADKPGTVFYDDDTDRLFEVFEAQSKAHYFVATLDGEIIGGGGIFPTI